MVVKDEEPMFLDVICQHKSDGTIIPLKIRIKNEEGEYQVFSIKAYKELGHPGEYIMPNGMPARNHIWQFECKIELFQMERRIRLFYNAYDNVWKMKLA